MNQRLSRTTVVLALCLGQAVLAAPMIQLLSAQPEKLLYDVGEPIRGVVTVKNTAKEPQVVQVRAWLEWQIDLRSAPQATRLTLAPGQTATASFTWKKVPEQFGYAFKADVAQNGQILASGEDYFQVSDNYWKVSLICALGSRQKTPASIENMRKAYYNGHEVFFWAPDDFLGLTPKENSWYSGQARYWGAKEGVVHFPEGDAYGLKDIIALGHRYGIKAITYAKLTGGGPTGFEAARRRPEIVWNSEGVLSLDPDAESLARWDDRTLHEGQLPSSWLPVDYNMNDPKVVQIGIKALADSAEMFGWDGARWDGNFSARAEIYDLDGKLVERLTPEQRDARTAENMQNTKTFISARHPTYVYGYNYMNGPFANTLIAQPRETRELCRGGGLLMNEYIRGAADVNHILHRWRTYAETLVNETESVKRLGGYLGAILDINPNGPNGTDGDDQYKSVFTYAAGAHPYYAHLWGAFMTRYGGFCWDPALQQLSLPATTVNVAGNVWWDKWVFTRTLSPRHQQVIVHLINPPTAVGVGDQKTLPPAQKAVVVYYYPASHPGFQVQRVTQLTVGKLASDTLPLHKPLGVVQVTVPEVALWNILVFDLVKGGR